MASSPSPSTGGAANDGVTLLLDNDPARTNFDPATNKWVNWFKAMMGRMTKEGEFHFREHLVRENEAAICKQCEKHRDWLLEYSPVVRFLADKITDLNGDLGPRNIYCVRCPARITADGQVVRSGGGFNPQGGIRICANEMGGRKQLEDTLAHEMVHAWDHLRWNMDGAVDLRHAACTEIRAAMLSGECRFTREFFARRQYTVTKQFQACVRRKAVMSVMNRPACINEDHASKVVSDVWGSCFADTRPFDDIYK